MTHYESIDPDKVKEIFQEYFAVDKNTNEVKSCAKTLCAKCLFYGSGNCEKAKSEWVDRPVLDPEKDIDWERVPIDTPVIVWNSDFGFDHVTRKRHFSGIKGGCFGAYDSGCTSWSSIDGRIFYWDHCKLYRPEDVEKYRKKEAGNE